MERTSIGKTDLRVSGICLGTANFGTSVSAERAFSILDAFVELGGNFIDTANNYAFWVQGATDRESESALGDWLCSRKCRSQIVLATKMGAFPKEGASGFEAMEGLGARTIVKCVEESLVRLKTDFIDLLYAHVDDASVPMEETLRAFDALVKSGKVRAIGCSNHSTSRFREALETSRRLAISEYSCIQQRFSFLQPNPGSAFGVQVHADPELRELCLGNPEMTLLAYSPMLEGCYERADRVIPAPYRSRENDEKMGRLRKLAVDLSCSPGQLVLSWLRQKPPKIIPVIGVSSVEQLRSNAESCRIRLSQEQISFLDGAS